MIMIPLVLVSAISPRFDYGLGDINKPIVPLVALMMTSGTVYLWVILRNKEVVPGKRLLAWVFLLGLLARLAMFASTPVLENDHYRYLWDGGVMGNGFNPYQYSPREVVGGEIDKVPEALRRLAREADPIPKRINYPWLTSIYPPVSQAAFALAHIVRPWSLPAWRLVLLLLDLATLYLLFRVLRGLNLSLKGLVVYWWNPLLIKEIYNSGHMDVLIFPFVLGALLLAIQQRHILASGALGLAVGVKLWPAILLPVILRPLFREPKKLLPPVLLFGGISLTMLLPFFLTGLDARSGLTAYGRYWEMNDSLFMLWTHVYRGERPSILPIPPVGPILPTIVFGTNAGGMVHLTKLKFLNTMKSIIRVSIGDMIFREGACGRIGTIPAFILILRHY